MYNRENDEREKSRRGNGEGEFEQFVCLFVFFFKQKTAYEIVSRDWSSDVCSSDLCIDV